MDELEITCQVHAGLKEKMRKVENENKEQWTAINQIKGKITATLASTVATLVTLVIALLVAYFKSIKGG